MVEQGSQSGTVVSMGSLCMEWVFWDRIDRPTPRHAPAPLAPLLWDEGKWKNGILCGDKGSVTGQAKLLAQKVKLGIQSPILSADRRFAISGVSVCAVFTWKN